MSQIAMKKSGPKKPTCYRRYAALPILIAGAFAPFSMLPVVMSPALAQPPERGVGAIPSPPRAVIVAVSQEWKALREQVGALEVTDPQQAIERYQEFYEQRGHEAPEIAVQISSLIAQMYWQRLNDRPKAAETYEWALQMYGRHPAGARLKQEWELLQGTQKLAVAKIGQGTGGSTSLLALIERLNEAQVSNAQADEWWRASGVPVQELLQAAGKIGKRVAAARPRVMGLVARHGAELVKEPEKLPESVQLALAAYYTSVKDARAESIYRHLLAMLKEQPPKAREINAVWGLYEYYLAIGQPEQAADALMAAPEYTTHPAEVGNPALRAARQYTALGKTEKAQAAYELAKQSGYGWGVGVALIDQANLLIGQSRHEEARKLLTAPVEGQYADQVKMAMLSLLGRSYFATGEFTEAEKHLRESIAQAEAMELIKGEGLEPQVRLAHETLAAIEQRRQQPLTVEPRELRIVLRPGETPVRQWLTVRSYGDLPLEVTSDHAQLVAEVAPEEKRQGDLMVKEVAINLLPHDAPRSFETVLTVRSPQMPAAQAQVRVVVEVVGTAGVLQAENIEPKQEGGER